MGWSHAQQGKQGGGNGGFQTARAAYAAEVRRSGKRALPLQARGAGGGGNSGGGVGAGRCGALSCMF